MDKTQLLVHPQVGDGEIGLVRRLLKVAARPGVHALGAEFFHAGRSSGHEHGDVVEQLILGNVAGKILEAVRDETEGPQARGNGDLLDFDIREQQVGERRMPGLVESGQAQILLQVVQVTGGEGLLFSLLAVSMSKLFFALIFCNRTITYKA